MREGEVDILFRRREKLYQTESLANCVYKLVATRGGEMRVNVKKEPRAKAKGEILSAPRLRSYRPPWYVTLNNTPLLACASQHHGPTAVLRPRISPLFVTPPRRHSISAQKTC